MNMGTLQTLMERASTPYLTLQEMQGFAKKIIQTVGTMHEAGFLHNDIQPGNILLHRDGN